MPLYAYQFDFLLNQMRNGSKGSLAGGTVTFYAAGTTTPKAVWNDRLMTLPTVGGILTPVTLSADGTAQIYGIGVYKIVIKDSTGVTVYTYDNINVADPTYSDAVTDAIVNIESLTGPAQDQLDAKVDKVRRSGTASTTIANDGTDFSVTSTDSTAGEYASIVVTAATGDIEIDCSGALSSANDLTFTGNGRRITGDFSNAAFADRLIFQTSTTDSNTSVGVMSSGATRNASWIAYGALDPNNSPYMLIRATATTSEITSSRTGTGIYNPIIITADGVVAMAITASGTTAAGAAPQILIGATTTADLVTKFQVTGTTKQSSYTVAALPAGTAGCRGFVSDSNATLAAGHGNVVAGGGTNFCPVYHDGTNWRIG